VPIYTWQCLKDNIDKEELRAMGDLVSPKCPVCGENMDRVFTPVVSILKGSGWTHGDWSKLRKRSEDQGNKFFKRQPKYQELVKETLEQKSKEA